MADPKWQEILIQAGRDKLTKQDIYDYYTNPKIQKHILNATGKNEVILRQSFTPENVVLRRKSETGEPIFLRGKSDLQTWAEKRLTEVHPTYGRKTDHLLVDLDPGEDVSWEKVQQTAKQVAQTLGADPRVTGVSAQFSGHRGFYIRGQLDRDMNVDAAREKVKDLLAPLVKQDKELTIGVKTDPMYQIRLDTTPLKYRGSVKAPYSLSAETGLVAAPVRLDDLTKVKPGDFTIGQIVKKAEELEKSAAGRFWEWVRSAPKEDVRKAVTRVLGTAVPAEHMAQLHLRPSLKALREGGASPELRENLVKGLRERLSHPMKRYLSPTTARIPVNKLPKEDAAQALDAAKRFQQPPSEKMVTLRHGGVQEDLENLAKFGPNSLLDEPARGITGIPEGPGAYFHTKDFRGGDLQPTQAYAREAVTRRGGKPAVLEAEFPESLLQTYQDVEVTVPRSLWKHVKNPRVIPLEEYGKVKEAAAKKYRDRVEAFALTPDGKVIAGLYSGSAKNVAVPGGGIDPGETKNQAAKREFKEEAGIAIKNVRSLGVAPVLTAWSRKDKSYKGKDWQASIKKHPGGNRTHFVLADVDTAKSKSTPRDPTEFHKTLKARPIDDLIAVQRKAIQKHPDSDRLKQMRKRLEMLLKIKHTEKTAFDYEGVIRVADALDDQLWMYLWKKHQREKQTKAAPIGEPSYSMTPEMGPASYADPPPFAQEPRSMFRKESAKKEFAPGIPLSRKIHNVPSVKNKAWTLAVQRHFADRAGKHFDLRLVDPKTHKAHSFALPKAELPKPGQMRLAVQQATHTEDYAMNFEGTIPKGTYGSGKVEMALKTPVDIIKANANHIAFKTEKGDSYTMFRMKDKNWGIKNTTK